MSALTFEGFHFSRFDVLVLVSNAI